SASKGPSRHAFVHTRRLHRCRCAGRMDGPGLGLVVGAALHRRARRALRGVDCSRLGSRRRGRPRPGRAVPQGGQVTAEAVEAEAAPPTPGPPVITVTAEPVDDDQSTADATKEKQEKEEEAPFPAGQVLLGAGSALTLSSVALASAVGPWGLLLAPGAVAVGGGVFLATRVRKRSKRGRSSERGVVGGARSGARLGGGGRRSSGGGRGGVSPTHGGGRPAAARSVGLGARPAPTSRTAPWARGGTPRPGAGGRAVVAPPLRLRPAAGAGGRVPG